MTSPEYDTLQVEWVFDNACGWDSNPQHILLGGKVGRLSDPIQGVQVTEEPKIIQHLLRHSVAFSWLN